MADVTNGTRSSKCGPRRQDSMPYKQLYGFKEANQISIFLAPARSPAVKPNLKANRAERARDFDNVSAAT